MLLSVIIVDGAYGYGLPLRLHETSLSASVFNVCSQTQAGNNHQTVDPVDTFTTLRECDIHLTLWCGRLPHLANQQTTYCQTLHEITFKYLSLIFLTI